MNGMDRRARAVLNGMFAVCLCMSTVAGCGDSTTNPPAPVTSTAGTVTGKVLSAASNAPVSGATVKTETGTTTTAADGKFSVSAPIGDRTSVRVQANGFADAFPIARVTTGQATTLGVKLVPIGVTETVSVSTGGTVSVPNSPARVTIPANGLVPAAGGTPSGQVTVSLTPLNPAVEPSVMPGGFNGIAAGGGSVQPLESGGAMQVDVRDSAGARYTMAPGTTATIRIPLGSKSPNPPATMPLWFFDETQGVWREEGTATLQGTGANQYYEGTIARVTYWNADLVLDSIVVNGCVKDANGQVVANTFVQTEGLDYTGTAFGVTAADGTFSVAMRKNSRAKLGLFEFDQQTFDRVPLSNTVTVGPSATDLTLPNCLVKQPGPLAITTTALPDGTVGVSYNKTLAASGGVPGYAWSLNTGSNPLPAGLELNSAGVISGTPTAAGTTTITVKVTDSTGGTATKVLNLTIAPTNPPLVITTASPLAEGILGRSYSATISASGGTGARVWSVVSGTLPAGLALDQATGVISGTPTTAGTLKTTLRVQDSGSPQLSDAKAFDLTVRAIETLKITSTSPLPDGKVGTVYSTSGTATGGTGTLSWSVVGGTLPTGLTLNPSTGTISGTPTTAGTSTVTLRVQDSGSPQQSAQKAVDLTINGTTPPPPPPPPSCVAGATNCLTVSNAPASVGGTFVTSPRDTSQEVELPRGIGIIWLEPGAASSLTERLVVEHVEELGPNLEHEIVVEDVVYSLGLSGSETSWSCNLSTCKGLTVNEATRTVTFVNTVLTSSSAGTQPITLNGTLTYSSLF